MAHLIDADLVKAEVERLKSKYVVYADNFESVDDDVRCAMCEETASTLSKLLSFLDTLQEPSLPSNLDEAAEKFSWQRFSSEKMAVQRRSARIGFKAGYALRDAQIPKLPDNLEEAAKAIVIQMHPCMKDCSICGDRLTLGELVALVNAGVKWMAGQDKSRKEANIKLANTDIPVDTEMEIAFEDIWEDAEVSVEKNGSFDKELTEAMKALCHDFFESGKELMAGQGVKIGQTKIYLEDDGGEPPYDGKTWLDLESTEYAIPTDKFKEGDEVDIILRKK